MSVVLVRLVTVPAHALACCRWCRCRRRGRADGADRRAPASPRRWRWCRAARTTTLTALGYPARRRAVGGVPARDRVPVRHRRRLRDRLPAAEAATVAGGEDRRLRPLHRRSTPG